MIGAIKNKSEAFARFLIVKSLQACQVEPDYKGCEGWLLNPQSNTRSVG